MTQIKAETLRELLRYEPDTGKLYWLPRSPGHFSNGEKAAEHSCNAWNAKFAGKEALTAERNGYRVGAISDRFVAAHRAIWAIVTGEWPEADIDHINHDRADNRWANLRAASRAENMRNRSLSDRTTSGVMGVTWSKAHSKWRAKIRVNDKHIHLGLFAELEDAKKARRDADVAYGFHINHGAEHAA